MNLLKFLQVICIGYSLMTATLEDWTSMPSKIIMLPKTPAWIVQRLSYYDSKKDFFFENIFNTSFTW